MTSIAVAGVKGAGGVTTAALVLAAVSATAGPTTLVEADPSGGSLLGWCEQLRPAGDLYDVALSRQSSGLDAIAQPLGDIRVIPALGRPFRLTQALQRPRVPWPVLFGKDAGTVVVDVGRIHPDGPTLGLLGAVDVVVLVTPAEPGPVAATMEWASRGGRTGSVAAGAAAAGVAVERLRIVTSDVVGRRRNMTVTPRDLSAVTGAAYVGHLPHDPVAVDLLCRGGSVTHASLRRTRLVRAAIDLPALLADPARVGVTR